LVKCRTLKCWGYLNIVLNILKWLLTKEWSIDWGITFEQGFSEV
jgi:hypothetical protein